MADAIGAAIASNDLDALNRLVHEFSSGREWQSLLQLRDRARAAFERGYQLWPAAAHAAYRLALEAPGEFSALVLDDVGGAFAFGPLPEVVAATHEYDEIARCAMRNPAFTHFAYECVVRGEDLRTEHIEHDMYSVPLWLGAWEPDYLLAEYYSDRADFAGPDPIVGRVAKLKAVEAVQRIDAECDEALVALREVAVAWQRSSDAVVHVVAVEGPAADAISVLVRGDGVRASVHTASLSGAEAIQRLAWAGSHSGPQGRRRGAAAGRDVALHAAAIVAGFNLDDEVDIEELGGAVSDVNWLWWQARDVVSGWSLRIAVEDPADGVAFAIDAHIPSADVDQGEEVDGGT